MANRDAAANGGRELREFGHAMIDRMAGYLDTIEERAVSTPLDPAALARRFDEPVPRRGRPAEHVWADVWDDVVGDAIHLAHPMYMGHQVAPPLPHAVLADSLAGLLNQSVAVWEMSPTGTLVEHQVIAWLRQLAGFPGDADGTLVSGGSVANLTGLLAAREARFPGAWQKGAARREAMDRAVVFVSAHAHYSVERALGVLGLGADAAVAIPDRDLRLDVDALARSIDDAVADGRVPVAVVATAGSTATGLFDDLDAVATVSRERGVWLHVDGAHGASLLLSDRLRPRLRGIERADSLAWDPHKMMLMPISAGSLLVRDRGHLDRAFRQSAPYLFHPRPGESRSRDTAQRTLQCSRRLDALKLWVCMRHYGIDHLAGLQEKTVANAEALHRKLSGDDWFEPAHAPESNILCFRCIPPGAEAGGPDALDALQTRIRERYNASGRGWITATVLRGRRVLRVTLMNPRTEDRHLDALLTGLRDTAATLVPAR